MGAQVNASELIQALQQLQGKYEALANEYIKLKKEVGAPDPGTVTSMAESTILPLPTRHSADDVRRHMQATQDWRRKNPWALLKALVYARKIKRLNLFDFKWYQERVLVDGTPIRHPFRHFIRCGLFEGRDPSPGFDTRHYLERHLSRLDPAEPAIFHYIRQGRQAGLSCNTRHMSSDEYLQVCLQKINTESARTQSLVQAQLARHFDEKIDQAQHHTMWHIEKSINSASASLKKEMDHLVKRGMGQVQDSISLQNYMSGQTPLMEYRGFPINPDIGVFLVNHISQNQYDLIIEFGSGTSTALMARVLQKQHETEPTRTTRIFSLEHLPPYRSKTQRLLKFEDLSAYATVVDAPLIPFESSSGMKFQYYDCNETLATQAREMQQRLPLKIFAFVDGPPQSVNPKARLPALETLLKHFPHADIDLLLDDYGRDDEKAAAKAWQDLCDSHSRSYTTSTIQSERGALLMRTTYNHEEIEAESSTKCNTDLLN